MDSALARFIRNRTVGIAGTCLTVGVLIAAPAFAAHMAATERRTVDDETPPSSLEPPSREDLDAGSRSHPVALHGESSSAVVGLTRPSAIEDGRPRDTAKFPSHEVVSDSIDGYSDFPGPEIAAEPAGPTTINARIPGLSDDALARFKNRMYRKDI